MNLFLLLGNDVHSHEHVESVIHTATNVLVVNLEGGEGRRGGEGRGGEGWGGREGREGGREGGRGVRE